MTPGIDNISYSMLKHLPSNLFLNLISNFNKIIHGDPVPVEWKCHLVVPIPKVGKNLEIVTNFRPIAMSSCIGKLFENIIKNRLEWHLEHHLYQIICMDFIKVEVYLIVSLTSPAVSNFLS